MRSGALRRREGWGSVPSLCCDGDPEVAPNAQGHHVLVYVAWAVRGGHRDDVVDLDGRGREVSTAGFAGGPPSGLDLITQTRPRPGACC